MKKTLFTIMKKCRSCSILGTLITVAGILIAISGVLMTYSIVKMSEVTSARKELNEIKMEYQSTLNILKKVYDFSPHGMEAIDANAYNQDLEAIEAFKNLFIAKAIVATRSGGREEAIAAWKEALLLHPESKLCNYGLGMEYFKLGISTEDIEKEREYLNDAIQYLSHKSLSNHPQALYHIALAQLRTLDCYDKREKKYQLARDAIVVLNNTDKSKHPVGNVERNLAYAYCKASKYTRDINLAKEYREKSAEYFKYVHSLVLFDDFYAKHYEECMKLPSQAN